MPILLAGEDPAAVLILLAAAPVAVPILPGVAHAVALILPAGDLWADPGAGLTRAVGHGEASRQVAARVRQEAAASRRFPAEDPVAQASPSGVGGQGEVLRREVVAGQEGGGSREDPSAGPTSGRG